MDGATAIKPALLAWPAYAPTEEMLMSPDEARATQLLHDGFLELDITVISKPELAAGEIIAALPAIEFHEYLLQRLAAALGREVLKHPDAQTGRLFAIHLKSTEVARAAFLPVIGDGITRLVALPVGSQTSPRANLLAGDVTAFCDEWVETTNRPFLIFTAYPALIEEQGLIDPIEDRQLLSEQQVRRLTAIHSRMLAEAQAAAMQNMTAQTALIGTLGHLRQMGAQLGHYRQAAQTADADATGPKQQLARTSQTIRNESRALATSLKKGTMNALLPPQLRESLRAGLKELRSTGVLAEKHAPKITVTPRAKLTPLPAKTISSARIISLTKSVTDRPQEETAKAALSSSSFAAKNNISVTPKTIAGSAPPSMVSRDSTFTTITTKAPPTAQTQAIEGKIAQVQNTVAAQRATSQSSALDIMADTHQTAIAATHMRASVETPIPTSAHAIVVSADHAHIQTADTPTHIATTPHEMKAPEPVITIATAPVSSVETKSIPSPADGAPPANETAQLVSPTITQPGKVDPQTDGASLHMTTGSAPLENKTTAQHEQAASPEQLAATQQDKEALVHPVPTNMISAQDPSQAEKNIVRQFKEAAQEMVCPVCGASDCGGHNLDVAETHASTGDFGFDDGNITKQFQDAAQEVVCPVCGASDCGGHNLNVADSKASQTMDLGFDDSFAPASATAPSANVDQTSTTQSPHSQQQKVADLTPH